MSSGNPSQNRQQIATGLRAILGGSKHGAHHEHVDVAPAEARPPEAIEEPVEAPKDEPPGTDEVSAPSHVGAAPEPRAPEQRSRRTKPMVASEPAKVPTMPATGRVGTLDRPYVRQRDNLATRKVGVILPVDLAERLQIHCVRTRLRPNAFVERAIRAALEAAEG